MEEYKLICVNGGGKKGNNKFYNIKISNDIEELKEYCEKDYRLKPAKKDLILSEGKGLICTHGRVGESPSYSVYLLKQLNKILKDKQSPRKGYKLLEEASIETEYKTIEDIVIKDLIDNLLSYREQHINKTYVASGSVTQKQLDVVKQLINNISSSSVIEEINMGLLEIYRIIPRKMKNVNDFLITNIEDKPYYIDTELDNINNLSQHITAPEQPNQTILENFNLQFEEIKNINAFVNIKLKDLLYENNGYSYTIDKVYKVTSPQDKVFDSFINPMNNPNIHLFWHGSGNQNWFSIIQTSLLLNPNAIITGKMWGHGLYFSDAIGKSIGYTSFRNSYYGNGNSNKAYLGLFEVAMGNPFYPERHSNKYYKYTEKDIINKGANSLWADPRIKKDIYLKNPEMIVFNQQQCRLKYLVEIR